MAKAKVLKVLNLLKVLNFSGAGEADATPGGRLSDGREPRVDGRRGRRYGVASCTMTLSRVTSCSVKSTRQPRGSEENTVSQVDKDRTDGARRQ